MAAMADRCVLRGAQPPNPPFVNTSPVVTLSVDTGPLPDTPPPMLIEGGCGVFLRTGDVPCHRRRRRRRHRHR